VLFGKAGLLALVLVWFALYLPIGVAQMFFGAAKDDWVDRFTPSLRTERKALHPHHLVRQKTLQAFLVTSTGTASR
jgi:hypothetical protein